MFKAISLLVLLLIPAQILIAQNEINDRKFTKLEFVKGLPEETLKINPYLNNERYVHAKIRIQGIEDEIIVLVTRNQNVFVNCSVFKKTDPDNLKMQSFKKSEGYLYSNTTFEFDGDDEFWYYLELKKKEDEFFYCLEKKERKFFNKEGIAKDYDDSPGNSIICEVGILKGTSKKSFIDYTNTSKVLPDENKEVYKYTAGVFYSHRIFLSRNWQIELRPGLVYSNIAKLPSLILGTYARYKVTSEFIIGAGINIEFLGNIDQNSNGIGESIGGIYIYPGLVFGYNITKGISLLAEFYPSIGNDILSDVTHRNLNMYTPDNREIITRFWDLKIGIDFGI